MDLSELPAADFRRHPWEVARCAFYRRILDEAGLLRTPRSLLDVGAGDAWLLRRLLEAAAPGTRAVAWDAEYTPEIERRLAHDAPVELTFTATPPAGAFDLVLLLDVLEHVEDDARLLDACVREHLMPGGFLLLAVPSWQALFTSHDAGLGHLRRYSPGEARRLAAGAGLEVVRGGGLFHSLLVPRALQMLAERVRRPQHRSEPDDLEWRGSALAARVVESTLRLDSALSARASRAGVELPGLSWWALCRKH
jgi:SAM-dependent methyltransferase